MAEKQMDNKEALRELLKLLADNPDLAERITITIKHSKIKPSKATQGTDKK